MSSAATGSMKPSRRGRIRIAYNYQRVRTSRVCRVASTARDEHPTSQSCLPISACYVPCVCPAGNTDSAWPVAILGIGRWHMRTRKTLASLRLGSAGPLMFGGCERRLLSRATKETTLARDSVSKPTKPLGQVFERPTPPPIHCWEGRCCRSLAHSLLRCVKVNGSVGSERL
jgi:hypothetical protein